MFSLADSDFENDNNLLEIFAELDDNDIFICLKYWKKEEDFVLSNLSEMILNRNILKIKVQKNCFIESEIKEKEMELLKENNISSEEVNYFIFTDKVSNSTYNIEKSNINILMKNGDVIDITSASDQFNIDALNKTVNKHFLCYPNKI